MKRQDLSCTYLAHHELESVIIITIINTIIVIIIIIIIIFILLLIIIGLPDLVPSQFANTTSGLTRSSGMPFGLLCFVLITHAVMPYLC